MREAAERADEELRQRKEQELIEARNAQEELEKSLRQAEEMRNAQKQRLEK